MDIFIQAAKDGNEVGFNGKIKNGFTALLWAASNNYERMVSLFINKRADINSKNNYGYTALMHAASNNYERMVSLLINRGADINSKNNDEWTALDFAERENYPNIQNKLKIEVQVNIYLLTIKII
jgi:ankyrin repeat protein